MAKIIIIDALVMVVIVPIILFFWGAKYYAIYISVASVCGVPLLIILKKFEFDPEGISCLNSKLIKFVKYFCILIFSVSFFMAILDKNSNWINSSYQLAIIIFMQSSIVGFLMSFRR